MTNLASYALDPEARKREIEGAGGEFYEHPEPERKDKIIRTLYHRDRDRIVWSTAFRRLQNKTQVFGHDGDDHLRRRLTHSMGVAALACSIARNLGLNEVATDAIALGHDIGHTPFGHAGEEALNSILGEYSLPNGMIAPIPLVGFDHCAYAIELLSRVETFNGTTPGLNLTYDIRDGILKHIFFLGNEADQPNLKEKPYATLEAIVQCKKYDQYKIDYGSLEAQCVWFADKLTYLFDDLEDAIRAKIFKFDLVRHQRVRYTISEKFVSRPNSEGDIDDKLKEVMKPLQCNIMNAADVSKFAAVLSEKFRDHYKSDGIKELYHKSFEIEKNHPDDDVRQYLFWRNKTITVMIEDCIKATNDRLKQASIKSVGDVLQHGDRLVDVSDDLKNAWRGGSGFYKQGIEKFLFNHRLVVAHKYNSIVKIKKLFSIYKSIEGYELIPNDYKVVMNGRYKDILGNGLELIHKRKPESVEALKIVIITNYIAGMSDAYANQVLRKYSG